MAIYEPTLEEIDAVLDAAAVHPPLLRKRLAHAKPLLLYSELYWEGAGWRCRMGDVWSDCRSSCWPSFHGCTCIDTQAHLATVDGVPYCKHKLALLAYRQICLSHLRRRLIGGMKDLWARDMARRWPHSALLHFAPGDGCPPSLWTWTDARSDAPEMLCWLTQTPNGLVPADEFALWVLADWLGGAAPLPQDASPLQGNGVAIIPLFA